MTTLDVIDPQLEDATGLGDDSEVVLQYFTLFNQGEYQQVAGLFSAEGSLYPPFEPAVIGPDKIRDYLGKEADGMSVSLLSAETRPLESGRLQVDVQGKVTALVFKVNVTWCFILTAGNKIESVRVDLVASLEELLRLRPE